ncbi:MAG: hypothetical protein ABI411_16230 [Tahibacter sp.]
MSQLHAWADDTAALADNAAARLRTWLLSGPAQLRAGEHAGAVTGSFDQDGRPRYAYPEITGYYLHWLADLPPVPGDDLRARAARAVDWADRHLRDGQVPTTRSYLSASGDDDWRNRAIFFFDLAMLLRGLCAAHEAGLVVLPEHAIGRLLDELNFFITEQGDITAVRQTGVAVPLPQRWSTLGGAFELKASSRVQLAAAHRRLPDNLRKACERLAAQFEKHIAALPLEMLHPTLYFAEGMLVAEPQRWSDIADLLSRCLALVDTDGNLPETEGETESVPRSDIIAQALRIGLLLRGASTPGAPAASSLTRLAQQLVGRVLPDGTIAFRPDVKEPQANVWCAMFAEQALRWYARQARGEQLPAAAALV